MQKKVVVVEQDDVLANELTNAISVDSELQVSGRAVNGEDGVKLCESVIPDYVIVDLLLSKGDGISVSMRVKEINPKCKIIMISDFTNKEIINEAMRSGAEYCMIKPVNAKMLVERIKCFAREEVGEVIKEESIRRSTVEEKISKIFINVGIPPHIKGYNYLREGVKMAIENPEIINSITKKLYPMIGEKYNTTASKVERAIRHAIEVAWNRGRIETINAIFGVRAYVGSEKPTNGEFIALVADKMLLEGVY